MPEKMRRELEEQLSPEQVEEGLKRLAGIISGIAVETAKPRIMNSALRE